MHTYLINMFFLLLTILLEVCFPMLPTSWATARLYALGAKRKKRNRGQFKGTNIIIMNSRIEKTDGRDYSAGGAYYEDVSGWKGGCGKVSTGGEAHNRSVFFFKESFILVDCSTQLIYIWNSICCSCLFVAMSIYK